jgi:hypothetical protein
MLRIARSAPSLLADAGDSARRFVESQLNDDGGFHGRSATSDLYYTVFGIECLLALAAGPPAERVAAFLRSFGSGAGLDLVHLACLARCWADLPEGVQQEQVRRDIFGRIESFRSADGGYANAGGSPRGTAYACFLALGAWQDARGERDPQTPSAPDGLARCLESLRTPDGGYANEPGMPIGSTPATAAAAAVLLQLGRPVDPSVGEWLLACSHPAGGFLAVPTVPVPDLLSTATALHALAGMNVPLDPLRRRCLEFVTGLQSEGGGFRGSWADAAADCEYTYYGLLALGHLSA